MNKKILYIGNKLSRHGNTATSIETLGAFLESEGHTLYYASSKKNQWFRMADMIWATLKYARKSDYVLIDTYSTLNFWYAVVISQLCRLLRVRYITKLHGGNLPERLRKSPFLSDLVFKNAYKITAPSDYLMQCFAQRPYQNLEYVPNSVDLKKYRFNPREIHVPKLLWVRSFASLYNPEMAIKVLYELQKEFPQAVLCMVGPDKENLLPQCKKLAQELGVAVRFTGKMSKSAWIALSEQYNLFINTTHFDNTPVSLIEAMAIGLPVVSTNVGGIPFLVSNNQTALLVEDNAVDEMVQAIRRLVQDNAFSLEMVTAARAAASQFDWTQVRHKWFEILK